ncbi:MAG: c-type cytochrome [Caldimonas sp.]
MRHAIRISIAAAATLVLALGAHAAPDLSGIGRAATPAEVKAWNIDVRGDFQGLPKGSGSVELGTRVWDAKCSSCHGAFGESNSVFTPIVGGTTKKDIESGHVYALSHPGYPHRTTLMKVSKLASLWDYINRAMPWNAPKSLKTDEVYGVLAYILNLGDIVPADFTLSDKNIAEVQARLPNRLGHVFYEPMWLTRGKGDVSNPLCMTNCPVEGKIESSLPVEARNSNGNIADQVRPFGPARGTDTSLPPGQGHASMQRLVRLEQAASASASPAVAASSAAGPASPGAAQAMALVKSNSCTSCHGVANKIVGPSFQDVAKKYAGRADGVEYLAGKIKGGGQGVWGPIPMPPQAQVADADAKAIAQWLAGGARP